ncbi:hypothetical protein FRC17_000873 [Serendipita sp. 399]|nr:hypothetical protein FRC17_000873 [Serendipita sp. 399]
MIGGKESPRWSSGNGWMTGGKESPRWGSVPANILPKKLYKAPVSRSDPEHVRNIMADLVKFDISSLPKSQQASYSAQPSIPATPLIVPHRVGGWLPSDHRVLQRWQARKLHQLKKKRDHTNSAGPMISVPVIVEFKELIEGDPIIYMYFHEMFDQVPTKPPYDKDPTGTKPQIRDYITMLETFEIIIGEAPSFQDNDLVGFPINAVLDWPMGTPAGQAAFGDPKVNAQFKKMFTVWFDFLTSLASCSVLNKNADGWFGPAASVAMPNFVETYKCNPLLPAYGFKSWDEFFTREFRDGVRPLPPDDPRVIISACESAVYAKKYNVNALDIIWAKEEPYALAFMLNYDDLAPQFYDGTVYQAFLSALKYHRWHTPIDGTVTKIVYPRNGTYYLESPTTGFANDKGPDPAAPNNSQAFISSMAARAIIFIQADNPAIGLYALIFIGMAEVSSTEVTVQPNQPVRKGDPLGMFHFGGSTHCLVFRPEVKVEFLVNENDPVLLSQPIATVSN